MLVLAGLIDLDVPDLLERWAPLFEQTLIDLDSSLTLGPVQLHATTCRQRYLCRSQRYD